MAFDASNLVLHVKRIVCSSIRLCYQYACGYPVVLSAGIFLLFLHKLCPSLFMFLVSFSPVFLLTALLLGALLTYGEPCAPVIGEETLENHQTSRRQSKTSTDCSTKEIEKNASVVAYAEKSFESQVVCIEERTFDSIVHDTHYDEEKVTSVSIDTVVCAEESSEFAKNNAIEESGVRTKEISKNVELQEFNTESYHNDVNNKYQLGELMSSCWQPVMRQDPCSDSESDFSGSSSDASMTDIIPMLDELNPPVNMGTSHPSSTVRGCQDSSSDEEDGSEDDGDLDGNDSNYFNDIESSGTENGNNLESSAQRRRAKNILKFDLDKKLMDLEAADAIQKMEDASRFRVQVPSISTPRPKPFVLSNGSEEIVELQHIPDSAPSVHLPWRKPFDIPFDQIVDNERKLLETWTPRSYFPSTRHRKNGNLHLRKSTYLQQHNGIIAEKSELIGKDACDSISDSDPEHAGNNGKLFGSLEAHMGEEIKILSAAISDACVLEANYEADEGIKNTNYSDDTYSCCIHEFASGTSESEDSAPPGNEQSTLCSLSKENNSEQHVEADSISEINSLFKCRMEEVLVQSISESGIGQPLTIELEDELSGTFSANSAMPVVEASSVEELNSRILLPTNETLTSAASDHTCDYELIQNRSSEALLVENGHTSQLPIKDGSIAVKIVNELLTDNGELPVLEASSAEEMNSSFKKTEDEAREEIYPSSMHKCGQDEGDTSSGMLVLASKSTDTEDVTSAMAVKQWS